MARSAGPEGESSASKVADADDVTTASSDNHLKADPKSSGSEISVPDYDGKSPYQIVDPNKMPVRLIPIPADELEHTEDKLLDSDYETRLLNAEDDLMPVKNAIEVAAMFSNKSSGPDTSNSDLTDSAEPIPNKAVEIAVEMGAGAEEPHEMPVLPDDPSESDLIEFASNHPAVTPILHLFRGKVISVRKK